jgi:hypothetical protein
MNIPTAVGDVWPDWRMPQWRRGVQFSRRLFKSLISWFQYRNNHV